jgi:hypothetical protein
MRADLGYVAESDLDLVIMLDAQTNGPLTTYLFAQAGLERPAVVTARRSTARCGGMRETDVEIAWQGGALFVEDKIDAGFTLGQPLSYATEVKEQHARNRAAGAVLVCPSRRLTHYRLLARDEDGRDCFDAYVTCAELAEVADAYAATTGDRLARGAATVLRAAEEPRPTGLRAMDPVRSAWGDEYRTVVAAQVPPGTHLVVGPASLRTATACSAYFLSAGVDPPAVWSFGHDLTAGEVRMDLMLDGAPVGLPDGVLVIKKKRMTWLLRKVPPVTFDRPATIQRAEIQAAVEAAVQLRTWAAVHAEL